MNSPLHIDVARALVAERHREAAAFAQSRNGSRAQSHHTSVVNARVFGRFRGQDDYKRSATGPIGANSKGRAVT